MSEFSQIRQVIKEASSQAESYTDMILEEEGQMEALDNTALEVFEESGYGPQFANLYVAVFTETILTVVRMSMKYDKKGHLIEPDEDEEEEEEEE